MQEWQCKEDNSQNLVLPPIQNIMLFTLHKLLTDFAVYNYKTRMFSSFEYLQVMMTP